MFFENLDALRAIAFSLVFIYHFFGYIHYTQASPAENALIKHLILKGHLGVNLFFVLSGFLITYLLLAEKEETGRIHIRHFYIRRILRIWPLYFAVIIIGFFLFPMVSGCLKSSDIKEHLPFYMVFLNNIDRIHTGFAGACNDGPGVLWSIAVEEQFYLFWPVLLSVFHKKYLPPLFIFLIASGLLFRSFNVTNESVLYLHSFSVMPDLVVGALLAWCCYYRTKVYSVLVGLNRYTILVTYVLLILAIASFNFWSQLNNFTRISERLVLALLFAFVIGEQCFSENSMVKLGRFKWLGNIGLISYGLYCLHLFCIALVQKLNVSFDMIQPSRLVFFAELIVCYGASLFVCYLSYRYFEKRFLDLKKRFTTVLSRQIP